MNHTSFQQTRKEAFSLIEIMVTVTLLAVIIIGLVTAFNVTQKALTHAVVQTDSMQAGRLASEMITREMEQMGVSPPVPPPVFQTLDLATNFWSLPQNLTLTNVIQTVFFNFTDGHFFRLVNYQVEPDSNGIGNLMRYEQFGTAIVTNQIIQGVVSFRMVPFFGTNGVLLANIVSTNGLPSTVQMELAVLENRTYQQYLALSNSPTVARQFLTNQTGHLHIFRQRIWIKTAQP